MKRQVDSRCPRDDLPRGWTQPNPIIIGALLMTLFFYNLTNGQTGQVELLLEQSPSDAGIVTPNTGVHQYAADSEITITAIAQDGYRFIYWLGDVSDPKASTTQVLLSNSKAVIAIFESIYKNPLEHDPWIKTAYAGGGGGYGGGLIPTASDVSMVVGFIAGGAPRLSAMSTASYIPGPVPVPEPATIFPLGLSILWLAGRQRYHKQDTKPRTNTRIARPARKQ